MRQESVRGRERERGRVKEHAQKVLGRSTINKGKLKGNFLLDFGVTCKLFAAVRYLILKQV